MTLKLENIFEIANSNVEYTLNWAKDTANLSIEQLRKSLVSAGKRCDVYLAMSRRYEEYITEQEQQINKRTGEVEMFLRWLKLMETGKKANDLIGYLTLLQMDAMISLLNMLEAKTDTERLMVCKHAYTILHDAQEKGLFKVVSKEMNSMPNEMLDSEYRIALWKEIKSVIRMMIPRYEVERVRNNIDAHKSASFTEQIDVYKQCDFGKSFANMFALMKIVDILHEAMDIIINNIEMLNEHLSDEAKTRTKRYEELIEEIEGKTMPHAIPKT